MATTTTTYNNNNNNSAHKQFETGHADQIHDCQYDYYGRVRFFVRVFGFFLLFAFSERESFVSFFPLWCLFVVRELGVPFAYRSTLLLLLLLLFEKERR